MITVTCTRPAYEHVLQLLALCWTAGPLPVTAPPVVFPLFIPSTLWRKQ